MLNLFKKKKREPKNLEEVLRKCGDLEKEIEKISSELEKIKKKNKLSVQKVGMIRYNPFSGVGSDQSFSIALLDSNNDGIVITSLYTREGNRVYGKPIENQISKYQLSEEEKKVIKKAIRNQTKRED